MEIARMACSLLLANFLLAGCTPDTSSQGHMGSKPPAAIDNKRLLELESEPGTWLTGGRDYQQSYHSPLKQIDAGNVSELGYAWHYDLESEHGYEATPVNYTNLKL